MRHTRLSSLFLVASCSSPSAVPTDSDPGSPDVGAKPDGSHVVGPAEPLVPASLGHVVDFAVGVDALYPIVVLGGKYRLVRCPSFTCDASPQIVGEVSTTRGRGVAIAGSRIYWIGIPIGSDATLMSAALDGSNVTVNGPEWQLTT